MNQFKLILEKCEHCKTYESLEKQLDIIFRDNANNDSYYHFLERQTWDYIHRSDLQEKVCDNVEWNIIQGKSQIGYIPVFNSESDLLSSILYYLQFKRS